METILIQTLIFVVISAAFAILLTIADRTINNYGIVKLTINDEKDYDVKGGSSLLTTLIDEKIFIPSACGGKGTCGYCKVKVLDGGGPLLATERPFMNQKELENHTRLSCQCKVKEDIKISIPEELFNVKEFDVEVTEIEDLTDVIKRLRFRLPEGEEFTFKPGQYVQLKAPLYKGNTEEVYRAYSIASSPNLKGYFDLIIGYVPEGIATTYVHHHLNVGDVVNVNGPFGDFYYHDNEREMVMVAVGTGVAPILSILNYMREEGIKRKARFYFGAKSPSDLFMLDYFAELEREMHDFKFVPTLSRVTDEDNWQGDKGRVNNAIDKYLGDGENKEAYLCGSEKMIATVVDALIKNGMDKELIFFDEF